MNIPALSHKKNIMFNTFVPILRQNKKLIRWNLFCCLFFVLLACTDKKKEAPKADTSKTELPNIVFIFADDMGYGDPGCFNPASKIPTPHIDKIAQNGVRLTDAHAPGAWCVPSRYGLMTGRYPARTELDWQERALIAPQQVTLASLLKEHDYYTAMVGKWHLGFDGVDDWQDLKCDRPLRGGPIDHGFDEFFGLYASLDIPPYFYIENDRCLVSPTEMIGAHQTEDATTTISGAFWREGKIAPGFKHAEVLPTLTNKSLDFLKEHDEKRKGQPFFLYLALPAPHTPWLPTEQFQGKSRAGDYGDFVVQVDYTVGQVRETLEKQGLLENTLLIFTSDNGPVWFDEDVQKFDHRATAGLRGMKVDLWEGGHRIPFVAQWPGKIPKGIVRPDLFCFTDMLATFAAIVGDTLPVGAGEDSFDQLPVLLDQASTPVRRELLIEDRVFRQGDWKYIQGSGEGSLTERFKPAYTRQNKEVPGELYNLKQDLGEQHNLYHEFPDKVEAMELQLRSYTQGSGDAPSAIDHVSQN